MKLIIGILLAISFFSCQENKPDEVFYKKSEILDIRRDDDGEYHLLVRFEDGVTISVADANCDIKMGNYPPTAEMPYIKKDNNGKELILEGWGMNGNRRSIIVQLPLETKIDLIND